MIDLDTTGGSWSWAIGINNAGQIAGYTFDANGMGHVTEWNADGTTAPVDILGGYAGTDKDTYILEGLATPINNAGQIVGSLSFYDGVHKDYAFLWDNGNLIDMNTLLSPADIAAGIYLDWALGINDNGAIWGSAHQGTVHGAFVLTPAAVPVPGAVWLFGSALAGLLGVTRRKQAVAV
jgi:probable HAF family extracellular repeat protein